MSVLPTQPVKKDVFCGMKNIVAALLLVLLVSKANCQTTITGGTLNNPHWTLAGSPYLVTGNISQYGTFLIDAGVEVILQDYLHITINGNIYAMGTSAQPIVFKRDDTTGWHNDIIQNGGWRGIYFNQTTGLDSSVMQHTIIQDVKHGLNGVNNSNAAIFLFFRGLKMEHCEMYHNQSTANQSVGCIITGSLDVGQKFEMSNCNFHDNSTRFAAIKLDNTVGGNLHFHHSRFHHNSGGGVVYTIYSNLLFEHNEVDSNSNTITNFGTLRIDGGRNTVRSNKFHHNVSENMAPIGCGMGQTLIEKNFICNNQMLNGNCGITDGGSGIHISNNNGGPQDSTFYTIRENIIANNYANFHGAGIYIFGCKADIINNHIINNKSTLDGPAISAFGMGSELNIQNNIFYGNQIGSTATKRDVNIFGNSYSFDYNYIEHPFSDVVNAISNMALVGDTIHNVIATSPMFINPTTSSGHLDEALLKDFRLTNPSPCVNKGNNAAVQSSTDYFANLRIQGSAVDIGAHELLQNSPEAISSIQESFATMYPNPAYDMLYLVSKDFSSYQIQILNQAGQLVLESQSSGANARIDISTFRDGMYQVLLQHSNGKRSSMRFVKR
ncbi:MAG: hypothetical protein RL660_1161 [Bacteroidota bacterium]|jgi:hypothetical protein